MRGFGPDVVSVVGPTRGLTIGYLLYWYLVVCTVESLSLFFILNLFVLDDTSII